MKILVCNPSMYEGSVFLPYLYGLFRRHQEMYHPQAEILWLPPLFDRAQVDNHFILLEGERPDVLAFSCYEWNFKLNQSIAQFAKNLNPNVANVFGGPHVKTEKSFFKVAPAADYLISGEGEETFSKLLGWLKKTEERLPAGVHSRERICNSHASRLDLSNYEKGVYDLYFDQYKVWVNQFKRANRSSGLWSLLETNRGCPYRCTFCDWGSLTNSKLTRFPLKMVKNDIEALAALEVDNVFIADANFGILERDEEVAEALCKTKARTGFPKAVWFNMVKNSGERLARIYEMLIHAGLIRYTVQFPMQSHSESALANIKRKNLDKKDIARVKQVFTDKGIPVGSGLIVGCPGETLSSWRQTLYKSLRIGSELRIFDWFVLPNAPVNRKAYIDKFQLKFIERPLLRLRQKKADTQEDQAVYLVGSYSYTAEDWIEMKVMAAIVMAQHTLGICRDLYLYGQKLEEPYCTFVKVLDEFQNSYSEIVDSLRDHYREFISKSKPINVLFGEEVYIEPEEYVAYTVLTDLGRLKRFYFHVLTELGIEKGVSDQLSEKWIGKLKTPNTKNPLEFIDGLGDVNNRKDWLFRQPATGGSLA